MDAWAQTCPLGVPWNDRSIAIIIMQTPMPIAPRIIGILLPSRSAPRAGTKEPAAKARLRVPPTTMAVFLDSPTLVSRTVGA